MARAPDIGGGPKLDPNLTLDATQAAAARATHNQPNALGKPFAPNQAEKLLATYQEKRAAWKEQYARDRKTGTDAEEEYYEAKRQCLQAGLMDPNS